MSFYNANIKSREIEASFSSNQKVQIDIDDGVYLSDMVLTLTPVLSGTMPVGPEGHNFVVNAGVYACINKIVLRSGLQIISQMNKVAMIPYLYSATVISASLIVAARPNIDVWKLPSVARIQPHELIKF